MCIRDRSTVDTYAPGRSSLDLYAGFNMQGGDPSTWRTLKDYNLSIGLWGAHDYNMLLSLIHIYSHEPTGTWAPHKYQYYRANSIDNYAGYWTTTKSTFAFGGPLPTLYTFPNDYLGGPMDNQIFTQSYNCLLYTSRCV